jgi:hypothetical protein
MGPFLACVTARPAETRYDLHQPPERIMAAVEAAGRGMDWTGPPGARADTPISPGHLVFAATPWRRAQPLDVSATPQGQLVVRTNTAAAWEEHPAPQPENEALVQATRQLLDPADVPRGGRPVSTRSAGLAVALDVLEPIAGGVYTHQGDEVTLATSGWSLERDTVARTLVEAIGAGTIGIGLAMSNAHQLRFASVANLSEGVVMLLGNRLVCAYRDLRDVHARNQLAASGLLFDLEQVPPS